LPFCGAAVAPELAIADGALGFWKALAELWPTTLRCALGWAMSTCGDQELLGLITSTGRNNRVRIPMNAAEWRRSHGARRKKCEIIAENRFHAGRFHWLRSLRCSQAAKPSSSPPDLFSLRRRSAYSDKPP
jgi:hypothetical protein